MVDSINRINSIYRVFAIYQILLGWKTHKYHFETDELTNPRPIPKNSLIVAFGPLFPTAIIFSWVGIDFVLETDYKKPNPAKFSANTLQWLMQWLIDRLLDWLIDLVGCTGWWILLIYWCVVWLIWLIYLWLVG